MGIFNRQQQQYDPQLLAPAPGQRQVTFTGVAGPDDAECLLQTTDAPLD